MTYLVGYGPHDHGAIELACQFARSEPAPVIAVSVVPRGWGTPAAAGTDREFTRWAAEEGSASAELALKDLARHPEVESSAVWVQGRSVPQTLLEQAEQRGATILVVGSSDDVAPGTIGLSSKTDRLVHSSPIPVALAPHSYTSTGVFERITVGFRDDDGSWSLLKRAAQLALRTSARLRIITFVVTPTRTPVTNTVPHAETQVIDLWTGQAREALAEAETELSTLGFAGDRLESSVISGTDWRTAIRSLEWSDGDVLVVGSSSTHRLAQVFLGSSASKIVRHSPVPVVVVPGRGA
ncbi:universal stress protein [Microbacterium sp.]|uniref:universal stress protein n=1 Tax=Microbacterium sp. TaxID=51671 RepID=UPI003C792D69